MARCTGVFIYIGRCPPQDIIRFDIELDEQGFIVTDDYMRTNISGVYAAGDIRSKQVRQIAPAVSDGMIAAINVERDFFDECCGYSISGSNCENESINALKSHDISFDLIDWTASTNLDNYSGFYPWRL